MVQSRVPRHLLRYHAWLPLVIGTLIVGIFLVDLLTPMSVIVSMLYAIPIYLTRFLRPLRVVPAFAVLCTVSHLHRLVRLFPHRNCVGGDGQSASGCMPAVCLIWGTAYLTTQIKVLYGYSRLFGL